MLNYIRSDNGQFIYVSLQSYQSILGNLRETKNLVLGTCLIALFILIISYIYVSIETFKPVRKIVNTIRSNPKLTTDNHLSEKDEIGYISHTLDSLLEKIKLNYAKEKENLDILRNSLLQRVLFKQKNVSKNELEEEFHDLNININVHNSFCVILMIIDDISEDQPLPNDLLLYAVANITSELLGNISNSAFVLDTKSQILLINSEEDALNTIAAKLEKAQYQIKRLLDVSVTIAVSDTAGSGLQQLQINPWERMFILQR